MDAPAENQKWQRLPPGRVRRQPICYSGPINVSNSLRPQLPCPPIPALNPPRAYHTRCLSLVSAVLAGFGSRPHWVVEGI